MMSNYIFIQSKQETLRYDLLKDGFTLKISIFLVTHI